MIKKISKIFLFPILLFLYNCQAPTTVVYEEGKVRKGMNREDMSKAFRFKMLGAHNPFTVSYTHLTLPTNREV